jgi:hypothetical protein
MDVVGLRDPYQLIYNRKKKRTLEMERVENVTAKRAEVHDQIPISYPVQRCYQPLKDHMSYSQHPNSSMLT